MIIRIEAANLPGIRCQPSPGVGPLENIHVGIGNRGEASELFRGDAASASWRVEVRTADAGDGTIDFRGRLVQGKRGDRFLYLNWGTVDGAGRFGLFRRAKVMLSAIDQALVRRALDEGGDLVCAVNLTDAKGNPSCARFVPPEIRWSVARQAASLSARS